MNNTEKMAWERTRATLTRMVDRGWGCPGCIAQEDILPLMPHRLLDRFEEAACNYCEDYHYEGKISFVVNPHANNLPPKYPIEGIRLWAEYYGEDVDGFGDFPGFPIRPETFWKDVSEVENFIYCNSPVDE